MIEILSGMNRRVVVSGLGTVNPLGINVEKSWATLISGGCGVKKLKGDRYSNIPCKVAATIPDELNILDHVSKSEKRSMSMATIYSLIASSEALKDANWYPTEKSDQEQTGVCVGMGMVDLETIVETSEALKLGYSKVNPFFVPKILPNMAAGHISIKYKFKGPNHTVSTACATGCHAIGDAFRFIRNKYADVMICGGTEACVSPLALAGFCRLRALSTSFNESPAEASRPFDNKREGFVMGEGSAILVLEELEHALNRNAKIYAEILGYGLSGDASHITAPHEDGAGAILAMTRAVKDAGLETNNISYVNAHATSTPLGDAIELKAVKRIFKNENLAVSSTKGAHGHLLGAAGNLESLFTILACFHKVLPPTINLHNICKEGENVNCVANEKQQWNSDQCYAIKNSFGFGGTNASLCIGKYVWHSIKS